MRTDEVKTSQSIAKSCLPMMAARYLKDARSHCALGWLSVRAEDQCASESSLGRKQGPGGAGEPSVSWRSAEGLSPPEEAEPRLGV